MKIIYVFMVSIIGVITIISLSVVCNGLPIPLDEFNGINFHNCVGSNVLVSTLFSMVMVASPIGLIFTLTEFKELRQQLWNVNDK